MKYAPQQGFAHLRCCGDWTESGKADFADAHVQIDRIIADVYRTKRIHTALGYLMPVAFDATWLQERRV